MHSSKQINIQRNYESKLTTIDALEVILNNSRDDTLITAQVKTLLCEYGIGKEDQYSFILNKNQLIDYLNIFKQIYIHNIVNNLYG